MDATSEDIKSALLNYNCQYSQDNKGDGIALVDVISPLADRTIERGLLEIDLLAEHISGELFYRNRW